MPKLYCGDIDIPGFHPRDLTESSMHRPNNREATAKSRTCKCVHDAGGSGVNRQWLKQFYISHILFVVSRQIIESATDEEFTPPRLYRNQSYRHVEVTL